MSYAAANSIFGNFDRAPRASRPSGFLSRIFRAVVSPLKGAFGFAASLVRGARRADAEDSVAVTFDNVRVGAEITEKLAYRVSEKTREQIDLAKGNLVANNKAWAQVEEALDMGVMSFALAVHRLAAIAVPNNVINGDFVARYRGFLQDHAQSSDAGTAHTAKFHLTKLERLDSGRSTDILARDFSPEAEKPSTPRALNLNQIVDFNATVPQTVGADNTQRLDLDARTDTMMTSGLSSAIIPAGATLTMAFKDEAEKPTFVPVLLANDPHISVPSRAAETKMTLIA